MKDLIFFGLTFLLVLSVLSCSSKARMQKFEQVRNQSSLLQQNYTDIRQSSHCGREPIVRFVSFSYVKDDSLKISIEITTSTSEKQIDGSLIVLTDEYELEYANNPTSKLYSETTEVEIQTNNPGYFRGSSFFFGRIIASALPKGTRKVSEKQYWNALPIRIDDLDLPMLSSSSEIEFIISTEKCKLHIVPSRRQQYELTKFLGK